MNVAALCSGPLVDICSVLKNQQNQTEYTSQWTMSAYRLVVLCTIISNVLSVCIAHSFMLDSTITHTRLNTTDDEMDDSNISRDETTPPEETFSWMTLGATIRSTAFLRFITLCIITIIIQTMFQHFDATLPKYLIREYGEHISYGSIFSINPAIIIIFVPLISAWTSHIDPLLLIHHGSYVSAVSVFFIALWTSIPSSILFMIVWSIGEAIWSPRLVDYLVSMSTEGKEGTFMALSSLPLFLAKLPLGWFSGYLLTTYCPESHECHGRWIWLIIAVMTMTSPIFITIFWKFLSPQKESLDEIPDTCTRVEMESLHSDS